MPPKTKAATAKSFIGQPDSVLRDEFIQEVQVNGHDSELLPFSGSLQLPTAEQVVKLFFFFKEQEGLKNSHVSQDSISERVAVHVVQYWQMAGFNTSSEDDQNTHYRQLGGYTKKSKDIAFLNDQRW